MDNPLPSLPSPEDLRGLALRANIAATTADAAKAAEAARATAAAQALAAEQSAQAAQAAFQTALDAVVPPGPPVPHHIAQPPAPPPNPPAPPASPSPPAPNPSGGGTHVIGWVGFALAVVAILMAFVLFFLNNGKASESLVTTLHASVQSAIADLTGRVDKVVADTTSKGSTSGSSGVGSGGSGSTPPRKPAGNGPTSAQPPVPVAVLRRRETNPNKDPSGICGIVAEEGGRAVAYFMLQPYREEGPKKGNLQIMQVKEMKKGAVERIEGAITSERHTDCPAALAYVEKNWAKVVQKFRLPNTCLPRRLA